MNKNAILKAIEGFFKFGESGTDLKTEAIAGTTTFMTMAYIIFVNPAMISQTGMDFGSAMTATCLSAALATLMMGLYANYPIALAPGMGENAFFTYTVCITMGIPWQVALGCVFITGVVFIILTLTNIRQMLIEAIPMAIRSSIACGIGLLIAFLGLKDAGIIVAQPATFVGLGNLVSKPTVLAVFGLILTSVMLVKKVKGAMLWGILVTAVAGIPLDIVKYQGLISPPPSMAPTFMQMDVIGALKMGLLTVMFIFLFMDIFDTVGTLAGVA
ncbi:MAG TPA: NCS2 family permease, partial [Candidatus Omnitrophota bacterium]|nr:NCS2 family permease [Candidatus Omnitrophota bacterium]